MRFQIDMFAFCCSEKLVTLMFPDAEEVSLFISKNGWIVEMVVMDDDAVSGKDKDLVSGNNPLGWSGLRNGRWDHLNRRDLEGRLLLGLRRFLLLLFSALLFLLSHPFPFVLHKPARLLERLKRLALALALLVGQEILPPLSQAAVILLVA